MSDPTKPGEPALPRAHPHCHGPAGHVCQRSSARRCLHGAGTPDRCRQPAGTLWGPLFCPEHDMERIDRMTRQLAGLSDPERWG